MNFQPLTLAERELYNKYYHATGSPASELTFANLMAWQEVYQTKYAIIDKYFCMIINRHGRRMAILPLVDGHLNYISDGVITKLQRYFIEHFHQDCWYAIVTPQHLRLLDDNVEVVEQVETRDDFDYVYLREKLTTLSGRKLQAKRNHVSHFKREYPDYQYFAIGDDFISKYHGAIIELTNRIPEEQKAILYMLEHFSALQLSGGYIIVDNHLVAFTIGEVIDSMNMAVVHIEKANLDYHASFQIINQEFVAHCLQDAMYINREQDLGIEGLRKTKLSYHPDHFIEKSDIILTGGKV
ncbi:DUF2156 domain-containing protein [Culicoidibacter larvae]|uniref:DUF2156 domain-containing protein n=1 Tax=Culicoidibacter larvae TaxID=2579976 RepID=A0A5R8QDA9_9FIRM|nr:phosphatidylglycerol lysyltransferase domain-containing protein [Culicoidibacter larvae]TLG74324.1 DUF2156 domain-containing protein [Culicoidibacter larvae]